MTNANNTDGRAMNGGARIRAGRKPKEIIVPKFKQQLKDYLTPESLDELVCVAIEKAKKDSSMMRFVLEQVFGRAIKKVEIEDMREKEEELKNQKRVEDMTEEEIDAELKNMLYGYANERNR